MSSNSATTSNSGGGGGGPLVETAQMIQRLLNDLSSTNNEARSQAEAQLNHDWVLAQPNSAVERPGLPTQETEKILP